MCSMSTDCSRSLCRLRVVRSRETLGSTEHGCENKLMNNPLTYFEANQIARNSHRSLMPSSIQLCTGSFLSMLGGFTG